jgi:hypothetical protein
LTEGIKEVNVGSTTCDDNKQRPTLTGAENPSSPERLYLSKLESEAQMKLLLRMHSLTMEVIQRSAQSYWLSS